MDGLISLLLFAGAFYLMMRFGCGAHMAHGYHGSHGAARNDEGKHVDSVCGKKVPPNEGYGKMYEDRLYRFCSRQCLDAFETEPERYLIETKEIAS
jgi:YHS domain-containing protein